VTLIGPIVTFITVIVCYQSLMHTDSKLLLMMNVNSGRRRRDLVYEGSPERRHRTNADDLRPEDRGIWTIN